MENQRLKLSADVRYLVGAADLGALWNMTPQMVDHLRRIDGMPRYGPGKYDLVACSVWYKKHLTEKVKDARRGGVESEAQARARKVAAEAELKEIDLAVRRGEVIAIADAVRTVAMVVMAARAHLQYIPSKVSPVVFGAKTVTEIESLLREHIDNAQRELATLPDKLGNLAPVDGRNTADGMEDDSSAPPADGERMGGQKPPALTRGKRRAGAVENGSSGVSARNHERRQRAGRRNDHGDVVGTGGQDGGDQ